MTRNINIVFGPPGTGKTTYLLDRIEEAMAQGIPPERIAFFAFTRKAAREAITRACERFNLTERDLPWFRTMHSAAFRILGLTKSDVMQKEDYDELSSALGSFTFEYQYDESTERAPMGGGLGDRCMNIYSLARAMQLPVEEVWRKFPDVDVSLANATRFANAMDDYKDNRHIMDFADFLDAVHTPLGIDLLIVDEAQDLTSQQWGFVRRVGREASDVYIAGDDDQAIFQWAGADLRTFLSMRGNLITLPYSHRLPRNIFNIATRVSSGIRVRRKKDFDPKDDLGVVDHIPSPDEVDLRGDGSWLMLARNKYTVKTFVEICRNQGVVYHYNGLWSNQASSVRAAVDYEVLRSGQPIDARAARNVLRHCPGADFVNLEASTFLWDSIAWPFEGKPTWIDALKGLGTDEREYIRRLRREGESLRKPGRVTLSTIHGAKGGEADHVLLVPDITKRVRRGMEYDPDQEARVWYVAASRARQSMSLCAPQTGRFYHI